MTRLDADFSSTEAAPCAPTQWGSPVIDAEEQHVGTGQLQTALMLFHELTYPGSELVLKPRLGCGRETSL